MPWAIYADNAAVYTTSRSAVVSSLRLLNFILKRKVVAEASMDKYVTTWFIERSRPAYDNAQLPWR